MKQFTYTASNNSFQPTAYRCGLIPTLGQHNCKDFHLNHFRARAAIILFALAGLGSANAADWKLFRNLTYTPNSGPGARAEYDAKSITNAGALVSVWERFTYDSPKTISGFSVSVMKIRYHYDCDKQTFYSDSIRAYGESGSIVYTTDEIDEARPLLPHTDGYDKLIFFCAKRRATR